jgi:hypothetical protein
MCKHVAAVLYGVGARFDHQPELLFRLRQVDETDLIANAGKAAPLKERGPSADKLLGGDDLAGIFGLDMAQAADPEAGLADPKAAQPKRTVKKAAAPKAKRKPLKKAASKPARKPRRPADGIGRGSQGQVPVIGAALPKWSLARLRKRVTESIEPSCRVDNQRALHDLLSLLKYQAAS